MSLTQVARGIISPATLSRWENGKGEMDFGNVVSLLQRLNIYLDESISIPQYSRKDNAAKTNPCHIADYYESKKLSSQTKGFKKIAIASIHKLIRTIYALIINDQLYDYDVATHNQKDFSRN